MFRIGLASVALFFLGSLVQIGQAVADVAPAAPKMETQAFSSWLYRCQETADGKQSHRTCEVAQEMVVQKDDKSIPVLTMAFARADATSRNHVVTILAPLGVRLKSGLAVMADDGKPMNFDFGYCDQRGCWITGEKGDALLTALKRGRKGAAKMILANGRALTINFSLAGLEAGAAALDSGKPPVPVSQTSSVASGSKNKIN